MWRLETRQAPPWFPLIKLAKKLKAFWLFLSLFLIGSKVFPLIKLAKKLKVTISILASRPTVIVSIN